VVAELGVSRGLPPTAPPWPGAVVAPVVDARWLVGRDDVVLADVRWYLDGRSGREAYDAGHLPGAVFVDLDRWLSGPGEPTDGRHPLPEPDAFAHAMASLGIGEHDVVVAYDDAAGTVAARLVWLLRVSGHEAALLDGGLRTWSGPLTTAAPDRPPAVFRSRPWPVEALASTAEVAALLDGGRLDDGVTVVLDARAGERYRGEVEPVDPRAGHLPGARSLPATANLAEDGRVLPVAQLIDRFAAVGVRSGTAVVSSCGSGVTACHTLLLLEHAGLGPGRLYPGSFSAWSSDPDRPVATGPG